MITRLGDLEVLHALKSGGMGDVLLGRRRGPGGFEQLIAVKTIRAELAASDAVRTMFLDEARLLARLTHPAIAQVLDFGEQDGVLYLALEYVRGVRFRELAAHRPPPAIAARAIAEACRGLHAAHQLRDLAGAALGVVHRDISPENLMLGFDGQVKVLDFGIALVKGRATVTEHGTVKGKPPYMSPEQVRGEALDRRSDVFSVALVLHELLTDRPVFDGESLYAVARAVIDAPIRPPSEVAGIVLPDGLDAAVMAGLERDAAARTPSAAALAELLERIAAAAGGESLASWTDHALAVEREAQRAWLAAVLGGGAGGLRPGRASGAVTAAAPPEAEVPEAAAPPPALEPAPPAAPPPALVPERPPRRRAAWVVLLVVVLVGGLAAWLVARRDAGDPAARGGLAADADADAGTAADAAPVEVAAITDAAAGAAPDAAVAIAAVDAGPPRVRSSARAVDAGVRPRPDEAMPPPPPDEAAVAAVPGRLTITADPFALIRVDGKDWGTTPIYRRRIAPGPHEIELLQPDSGEVRLRRTVEIQSGQLAVLAL